MAVELGCIKTLDEARAYINAELSDLWSLGCGLFVGQAQALLNEIELNINSPLDPSYVDLIKDGILKYQNSCRASRGLDLKPPEAARQCGGYTTEPAGVAPGGGTPPGGGATPGGGGGVTPPPTSPAGMGWLGGLVLGGAALWLLFGKKKGRRR